MTTKYREVDGIKYAEGVEPAEAGSDEDVAEDLKQKPKGRITTFLDMDVILELKRRAAKDGDGKYQTFLNAFLRKTLMLDAKEPSTFEILKLIRHVQKLLTNAENKILNGEVKTGRKKA